MSVILTQTATKVRRSGAPSYADGQEASFALSEHGALLVQQALPPMTELVRLGKTYYGKGTTTTATLNQTIPTTTAAATLYNGNSAGGASYLVHGVGFWTDVSGGAANLLTIYVEPSIVALATLPATSDTPVIRNCRFGAGVYGGSAGISHTVTVTDNGWLPIFTMDTAALTANKGIGTFIPLNGLFVVAPGYYLAAAACGTAATAEVGYYFVWSEVQLNLL